MRSDVLQLASDLARRGEAFALATVVRRGPPSSAQVGDVALITASGAFMGWLGGSCTQPTVVREARRALAEGTPRLIVLTPDPALETRSGVAAFPMTCHSGGSVDIYIDPLLPVPRLVVFGVSPVAQALGRLGRAMGYAVDAVDPEADRAAFPEADRVFTSLEAAELRSRPPSAGARVFAVVATMGFNDVESARAALAMAPDYLGVIASKRRFEEIRTALIAGGATAEALGAIRSPAGLDIGAHTAQEIALSVLAEIVQRRPARADDAPVAAPPAASAEAIDPVCGMAVTIATAKHRLELGGRTWYFCAAGCRERFRAEPGRYGAAAGARGPA